MGGAQVFTYNLLNALIERGHQVDLYISSIEYRKHRSFYSKTLFNVKPLFFQTDRLATHFPIILATCLHYITRRHKYDIWQIIGAYPAGYLVSSLSGKVPLVLRTHGDDIQKDKGLKYGLRLDPRREAIIQKTLTKMDKLVALSKSITECYYELGISENKIIEIPHGIDLNQFQIDVNVLEIRKKWKLPTDKPLLLTVGRYHPKKGYNIIPKVARMLKDSGLSFFWLIIGYDTEKLLPLIMDEQVDDVVRTEREIGISNMDVMQSILKLPDDELVYLYQAADIFVFPSLLESFGRVLLEAMAAGLPIVSTDAPGCRDVIQHEHTGLLAKRGDINDLFQKITQTI
ncbi:MAG: glycosyltransferase family 4 protein, partial [Bacteroidetes bacterium]|nr:glycosyltransferase family 4 protein [Bacteroidota bacterium]